MNKKLSKDNKFPVVCLGASAGGLEAFIEFFKNMPTDSGMAFVVVQHLFPEKKSPLSEIISQYTKMEICTIKNDMDIEPNNVYVMPENHYIKIQNKKLHLYKQAEYSKVRLTIDIFLRSLAEDLKEYACCIILSGTGSDGTMGLKAIKGEEGLIIVQKPENAKFDGMPYSAISTGYADFILDITEIPQQLISYFDTPIEERVKNNIKVKLDNNESLKRIFSMLNSKTGNDFSEYKQNTIIRRINRRMIIKKISTMEEYSQALLENPDEALILFKELLIGVTSFFRDRPAFEYLKNNIIPNLIDNHSKENSIRIWVPACSTGEEAYTLAILFHEYMENQGEKVLLQIFATDIDNVSIEKARTALFPLGIIEDVPKEYILKYFDKHENHYQVKSKIRDLITFAVQNVIKDPPFSKVDMISCRNLLIYFNQKLQDKLLTIFHYSLNNGGIVFLGSSETIGEYSKIFSVIERKWKVFKHTENHSLKRTRIDYNPDYDRMEGKISPADAVKDKGYSPNEKELTQQLILESYSPTTILINEKYDILYIQGKTGKYLEASTGSGTLNIIEMAREDIRMELRYAIREAIVSEEEILYNDLKVTTGNGETHFFNLAVKPVNKQKQSLKLILLVFLEVNKPAQSSDVKHIGEPNEMVKQLQKELNTTKEYLQSIIEELELSNEELKSFNEEQQSMNEELETSKEEIQSVNEELSTVNAELENKLHTLARTKDYMNNLLASIEVGTIFVDNDLNIKWFTPKAAKVANLILTDIERPITHIVFKFDAKALINVMKDVIHYLIPVEMEIQNEEGTYFSARVLPYRTMDNVIDGAVITFIDINELKNKQKQLEKEIFEKEALYLTNKYLEETINVFQEPIFIIDGNMKIIFMNALFKKTFEINHKKDIHLKDLLINQESMNELNKILVESIDDGIHSLVQKTITIEFKNFGRQNSVYQIRNLKENTKKETIIMVLVNNIQKL